MKKITITIFDPRENSEVLRGIEYARNQIIDEWGLKDGIDFTIDCEELKEGE